MKKVLLTIAIVMCFISVSYAQDYHTAIGLRGGFENGLTIKHFTREKSGYEFILASRWRGFEITGLYEVYNRAFDTDRLKWFMGVGGHIGFWNGDYTRDYWGTPGNSYTVVGVDGIIGLEYCFIDVPINLSLDWKPAFNFIGYSGFWVDGGALSIRYIF